MKKPKPIHLFFTTLLFTLLLAPHQNTEARISIKDEFIPFFHIQAKQLTGLKSIARVARDSNGIAHIWAANDHDLYFLQGVVHAQDRLFQMDLARRLANGTLAELLGSDALSSDVEMRTLGIRRAAERSLAAISPQARAAVQAYAKGVNAFVAASSLPPEYGLLEISQFEPWTPLDSVAVLKLAGFEASFDLLDIELTQALSAYQAVLGPVSGNLLFFEDLFRSAPFDPAATIPDAAASILTAPSLEGSDKDNNDSAFAHQIPPKTGELCRQYLNKVKKLPLFKRLLEREHRGGSNAWAMSGAHTFNGAPLLASDPHLDLDTPSILYPIHLHAWRVDVIGSGFVGLPFVGLGHNRHIAWGLTNNFIDTTDFFQEQITPDASSPSGLSIVHNGQLEPIIPIPQVFRQNVIGNGILNDLVVVPPGLEIPEATLIVPRRNNGPIIELDLAAGTAISVQFTGFSATRELDAFRIWNQAKGLADFKRGLQFFDFGAQHALYADIRGNIAYFSTGEMPVREDLQAGAVNGAPPFFVRNGTGGNEWLPVQNPQPGQALPFEILPFKEMPQSLNPAAGVLINANNDPTGLTLDNNPLNQLRPDGGIYYLSPGYDEGFRAGRITQLIRQKLADQGTLSAKDMQAIQADTVMLDAQFFTPFILQAFNNAQTDGASPALAALAANPALQEAVERLANWDFSTPTGIDEGFDASDQHGQRVPPDDDEIAASIATTIYSLWRGQFIDNTIDTVIGSLGLPTPDSGRSLIALRHLLENFAITNGAGASGVNFFVVPGVASAADRRDSVILQSLQDALELLASDEFAPAFGHSTNQEDYRWGKLHRVVLVHPLTGPFNIPPAGGAFPSPLANPELPGIPTDGGFQTVDAANHSARASGLNQFMFRTGPAHRFVSTLARHGVSATLSLPGGVSGVLGSPNYANLLPGWLTNDPFPLSSRGSAAFRTTESIRIFFPPVRKVKKPTWMQRPRHKLFVLP